MTLALSHLSAGWRALFFIVAVVCFLGAAAGAKTGRVGLLGLGLASFVFVFAWDAVADA